MKASELKRLLRKRGCKLLRHGRRHDVWINPQNGNITMVPRHDAQEVRKGTFESILNELFGNN